MTEREQMLSEIKSYVLSERSAAGITSVDRVRKRQLSGEAFGEIEMLVDRQLLTTEFGFGCWVELEDTEILKGTYALIQLRLAATRRV